MSWFVHQGDYRNNLDSADLILTDPPYGNFFGNQRKNIKTAVVQGDDLSWLDGFGDFVRVVCPDGPVVLFADRSGYSKIQASLVGQGLFFINDAVWVKKPWGIGYNFRPAHEHIMLFAGVKTVRARHYSLSSVLVHSKVSSAKKLHPTQKPVSLLAELIRGFSLPGQTVCDPFVGSGSTGVAALQEGRNFIGSEIDPGYISIINKRMGDKS